MRVWKFDENRADFIPVPTFDFEEAVEASRGDLRCLQDGLTYLVLEREPDAPSDALLYIYESGPTRRLCPWEPTFTVGVTFDRERFEVAGLESNPTEALTSHWLRALMASVRNEG